MNKKTNQGSKIKTFGIAVNDYKLEKFETELRKHGYIDYEIKQFYKHESVSIIKVKVPISKFFELKNICMGVELYFKRLN